MQLKAFLINYKNVQHIHTLKIVPPRATKSSQQYPRRFQISTQFLWIKIHAKKCKQKSR